MNTSQGKSRPHFAAESMCVPGGGTTLVPVDRPMPCIVIFVHGVNSEGEWYDIAEKALVEGLNTRLGRKDLAPNVYDPTDSRNFQGAARSPVIRFYWGLPRAAGSRSRHSCDDRHRQRHATLHLRRASAMSGVSAGWCGRPPLCLLSLFLLGPEIQ